jgi:mono/diheme cytochrome c family protein
MKQTTFAFQLPKWLGAAFFLLLALNFIFMGCEYKPPENSRPAQVARGKQMYMDLCSGCHGKDAKGGMDTMGVETPNLTLIQEAWGGGAQFPIVEVAQKIDGRVEVKAHGPREMPAWGDVFAKEEKLTENEIRGKMGELISYLMTIQE